MPHALCPMPYASYRMPSTLWITFFQFFFCYSEISEKRIYEIIRGKILSAFSLLRNFEITKLFWEKCPMPYALCLMSYALYPMDNITPKLFLCFEISKLFEKKSLCHTPYALCLIPYPYRQHFS